MTSILSTATRHSLQPRVAATALAIAMAGCLAMPAAGQTRKASAKAQTTTGAERNTWRLIREMPAEQAEPGKAAPADSKTSPWAFSMGVSGNLTNAGQTLLTPLSVNWTSAAWYLEASSDGYQDAAADGVHSRGLSDLTLLLNRTITFGGDQRFGLTPAFELVLPSHGDVGSTQASQALRLTLARELPGWRWAAAIGVARAGEAEPEVSRHSKSASFKLVYHLQPDISNTSFLMSRTVRAGAPATNTLSWELEYALSKSKDQSSGRSRDWWATLGLTREQSAGTASNSIGLGIRCDF